MALLRCAESRRRSHYRVTERTKVLLRSDLLEFLHRGRYIRNNDKYLEFVIHYRNNEEIVTKERNFLENFFVSDKFETVTGTNFMVTVYNNIFYGVYTKERIRNWVCVSIKYLKLSLSRKTSWISFEYTNYKFVFNNLHWNTIRISLEYICSWLIITLYWNTVRLGWFGK